MAAEARCSFCGSNTGTRLANSDGSSQICAKCTERAAEAMGLTIRSPSPYYTQVDQIREDVPSVKEAWINYQIALKLSMPTTIYDKGK